MLVARLVAHARLRIALGPLPNTSARLFTNPGIVRHHSLSGTAANELLNLSIGSRTQLKALKRVWPTFSSGWRWRVPKLIAISTATGCFSRVYGLDAVLCEKDSRDNGWSSSSKDSGSKWDEGRLQAAEWVKRLWFPVLVVCSVFMGWHYPMSLFINLICILWSTKPSPASIHVWAEQRRMEQQTEKRGFDRLRAQLTPAAVLHVEVEDYMLFCLARVSSLTQKSLVIGVLGDWWPVYSASSSITAPGLGSFFPTEKLFPPKVDF